MSNRKARRAAAKVDDDLPALPAFKNLSGNDQCCGNCPKRANEKARELMHHINRQPKPDPETVLCLAVPGGGTGMKRWGWCSMWGESNVVKIAKDGE